MVEVGEFLALNKCGLALNTQCDVIFEERKRVDNETMRLIRALAINPSTAATEFH